MQSEASGNDVLSHVRVQKLSRSTAPWSKIQDSGPRAALPPAQDGFVRESTIVRNKEIWKIQEITGNAGESWELGGDLVLLVFF